ncbi:MAG: phage integrase SAM-like domain-containing protein [Tissierellia bacterium]|nr:phage integrase SAM-like domain-containing protein [Tissierellia bacterium]
MATVKSFIRTTKKKGLCNIRFRLTDGRNVQLFAKSNLSIPVECFNPDNEKIKAKIIYDNDKRKEFDSAILRQKEYIIDAYNKANKAELPPDWLQITLDRLYHPEIHKTPETLLEHFDNYVQTHKVSDGRRKQLKVLYGMLQRFSAYQEKDYQLHEFTKPILKEFAHFLSIEYTLPKIRPSIYEEISEKQLPKQRSQNRISGLLSMLRGFFNSEDIKKLCPNPFDGYSIEPEVYGTPIYISIEERNIIAECDLSARPGLAVQRDIFIFQCFIGCRVGDLMRFTKDNINNDTLTYIASKTAEDNPVTVDVPLSDMAKKLVDKYKGVDRKGRSFPFIAEQNYNEALKEIFEKAGITRMVAWLNPLTRKEELRPINEIASSHMARRTFIGNLYAKVKDPNLIGSMSGHVEGSKAFARYRNIDIDVKKETIKLID